MKKLYSAPIAAVSAVANDDICTVSSAASGGALLFELDVDQFT